MRRYASLRSTLAVTLAAITFAVVPGPAAADDATATAIAETAALAKQGRAVLTEARLQGLVTHALTEAGAAAKAAIAAPDGWQVFSAKPSPIGGLEVTFSEAGKKPWEGKQAAAQVAFRPNALIRKGLDHPGRNQRKAEVAGAPALIEANERIGRYGVKLLAGDYYMDVSGRKKLEESAVIALAEALVAADLPATLGAAPERGVAAEDLWAGAQAEAAAGRWAGAWAQLSALLDEVKPRSMQALREVLPQEATPGFELHRFKEGERGSIRMDAGSASVTLLKVDEADDRSWMRRPRMVIAVWLLPRWVKNAQNDVRDADDDSDVEPLTVQGRPAAWRAYDREPDPRDAENTGKCAIPVGDRAAIVADAYEVPKEAVLEALSKLDLERLDEMLAE
jgi:hypothetical protein